MNEVKFHVMAFRDGPVLTLYSPKRLIIHVLASHEAHFFGFHACGASVAGGWIQQASIYCLTLPDALTGVDYC